MLGIRYHNGIAVDLYQGDITQYVCDAMVNAANAELRGGGGVDGAIHAAGGPAIMAECAKLGGCATGSAAITGAGRLPCRHVIHAVGPVWQGGSHGEEGLLTGAYAKSLQLAHAHQCRHVAFSAISCGVYGYPLPEAAEVAMKAVKSTLSTLDSSSIGRVTFVLFSLEIYKHFQTQLFATFPEH